MSTFDPVQILGERFRVAIAAIDGAPSGADPLITPSKRAELGDFQSNAAMPLAKRLKSKPRDIAQQIVDNLDIADIAEPVTAENIAGPGFINVRLKSETLGDLLTKMDSPALGVEAPPDPQTVVVDVCGVNLAKQMHVGHLRATVIGDAIARLYERLGHNVVRQNHVGDWGLPIAMVTAKLKSEIDAGRLDIESLTLDDLDRLYKLAQAECSADRAGLADWRTWMRHPKVEAEFAERVEQLEGEVTEADAHLAVAKAALIKLQSHDPEIVAIWKRIYDTTMTACLATCARLLTNITDRDSAGESSYAEELAPLVDELIGLGVTEESDGALVIRVEGIEEPCIIRKRDGGFLYATSDMAGIRRRVQKIGGDHLIYVVDARQALHFRQVYGAATLAGYATKPGTDAPSTLEHAAFGMVLGDDRRPFKTRSGENVKLADLVDEAIVRAERTVAEKSPDMPADQRLAIAEVVGVAAIKYADLSNDRIKDYVFDFDRMLAFEGNTGPYLLYAVVRVRSIFRKAVEQGIELDHSAPLLIREPQEKTLALLLLRYSSVVRAAADSLEPHRMCLFLYDLATAYSSFFEHCPVLKADDDVRASRLRLCDLTARVLTDGLGDLGIPTLERM